VSKRRRKAMHTETRTFTLQSGGGTVQPPSGNDIFAASCSRADVSAAVDSAIDGDRVHIPAGTCSWTTNLTITKGISVIGAGEGQTIIQDNVPKGDASCAGGGPLMDWAVNTPYTFRISAMTIQGISTDPFICQKGHIRMTGTATGVRVDHLTVDPAQTVGLFFLGGLIGVVDHYTYRGAFHNAIRVEHTTWLGVGAYGDNSWAQPLTFGDVNALFIEDSTFTDTTGGATVGNFTDAFSGARVVIRHNTFSSGNLTSHGADSDRRFRGTRQHEIYNNTFTFTAAENPAFMAWIRGGTAVVFNNDITSPNGISAVVQVVNCRDASAGCGGGPHYSPWGAAGEYSISSITRSGSTASATTAASHGLVSGDSVRITGANETQYNGTFSVTVTGGTTFDYTVSGTPATPATGTIKLTSPWDQNSNTDGYRAVDQPGAGTSNSISGDPATPVAWVGNALDEIYVWNNTVNGASNNTVSASTNVVLNRDYYTGTARPSYTSYTYPHPLNV